MASKPVAYELVKQRAKERSAALTLAGQDIGALPPVRNPARRAQADERFRYFCEAYFPHLFTLAWSEDHLKIITKIEQAVIRGGLFSMAMPRGSGKALALDTPLAMPDGWTTMGAVRVGDFLFDEEGHQCQVVFATEVMHGRPCYRVSFSDGERIVCDAEHLWRVEDRCFRRLPLTLRTEQMVGRIHIGNRPGRTPYRYAVPSVRLPEQVARDGGGVIRRRFITAIEPVASVPVRCIQVNSPSQLYLAGRKMVPTHNTTLCQAAALWALLTGRHPFVFLVAATSEYSSSALANLKAHLSGNDLLLEDYPEVIYPIRKLEGESRRCSGQRYYGKLTHIGWTADEITLPTIPGSRCSGAIVRTSGLLGNIRGALHVRPDGVSVRPSLVVIDDPQTDQSARSPAQVHERLAVVNGAILNLAGPGQRIAAVMPCTVIRREDLADQILDRAKSPEWQGERTKLVYSFPANEKLWAEYARLRAESQRVDGDGAEATEFYRQHRAEMDAGAIVAWPDRYDRNTELSAIQAAMNLKLRNEEAFWAEYQNQPLSTALQDNTLTPERVMQRYNGQARGEVPMRSHFLTAMIDVHDPLLFWVVCAWDSDFTGHVVDYGTYPDQKVAYFLLREAKRTLAGVHPGLGKEGAIQAGLEALAGQLVQKAWPKAGGGALRIEKLLIDCGYKPGIVANVTRKLGGPIMPSKGLGIKAGHRPMSALRRKSGERHGWHWFVPNTARTSEFPHVCLDTNFWKSFVHARLSEAPGERGAMTLFGRDATQHELFAQHIAGSEVYVTTHGHGRDVQEWSVRAAGVDNHWLDCLVGCCAAASLLGAKLGTELEVAKRVRKSFRLSDTRRAGQ